MIPIEIQCSCGQKFAFEIEPVDGKMPGEVACTECGANLTDASNEQIRQQLAATAPPAPAEGTNKWMVATLCVAVLVLLGLTGGAYFYFNSNSKTPPPQEAVVPAPAVAATPKPSVPAASVPTPASVPASSVPAPAVVASSPTPEPPAASAVVAQSTSSKTDRDPNLVAVGVLFDRNAKTHQVEIMRVLDNSPAKKAGILVGDVLLKIDKKSLQKLALKEIADMVYGPVGSKITLDILEAATGKTNRIKITRKKYR